MQRDALIQLIKNPSLNYTVEKALETIKKCTESQLQGIIFHMSPEEVMELETLDQMLTLKNLREKRLKITVNDLKSCNWITADHRDALETLMKNDPDLSAKNAIDFIQKFKGDKRNITLIKNGKLTPTENTEKNSIIKSHNK